MSGFLDSDRGRILRLLATQIAGDPSYAGDVSLFALKNLVADLRTHDPLGRRLSADFNLAGDQAITVTVTKWMPIYIVAAYVSGTFTSAAGGIYTAVSKGGTAIVSAAQTYATLAGAADALVLTLNVSNRAFVGQDIYLNLTTLAGVPALADLYVFGLALV